MRRAYKIDVSEFSVFAGFRIAPLRTVTRAHVIALRKDLEARLESLLESYYARRKNEGEELADGVRMEFVSAMRMLQEVGGERTTHEARERLRAKGPKIPHSGDRLTDGSYVGTDLEFDENFLD